MERYEDGKYIVEQLGNGLISYPTPKGQKTAVAYKIQELSKLQAQGIKKLGADPSNYFACGNLGEVVLRNVARFVVEATIEAQKEANRREVARLAQAREERLQQAIAALPEGYTLCTQSWSNGDLMSAEYIPVGGGCKVLGSDLLVGLAGTEFYAIPTSEVEKAMSKKAEDQSAEEEKKNKQAKKIDSAKDEAARTGKNVVFETWTTNECMNGNHQECSFDRAAKYATPSGEIKIKYTCCY